MLLQQTIKLILSIVPEIEILCTKCEEIEVPLNGGELLMQGNELDIIQGNTKEFKFVLKDENTKEVDTSPYTIIFEVYEKSPASTTPIKRIRKTSGAPYQVCRQPKTPHTFSVYLRVEDTRNLNLENTFVYVLELQKTETENNQETIKERYTIMRGNFNISKLVV